MLALAVTVTIVIALALGASYLMTRAARFSPLANIFIGAFAVVAGFVLLVLLILVMQHLRGRTSGAP
jgi:hypothetical protein